MPEESDLTAFLSKLDAGSSAHKADFNEVFVSEAPIAEPVLESEPESELEPEPVPEPKARRKRVAVKRNPCCPNGHTVTAAMKFCPECGAETVQAGMPRCPNGHDCPPEAKFCAACGAQLWAASMAEQKARDSDPGRLTKEAAHARALALGHESPSISYVPGQAPAGVQSTIIHFLTDGFTAFGVVWMRGQEIELWPGHPRWEEAQRWITLDLPGQYARWGRQIFGYGPWPFNRSYTSNAGHFQQLRNASGEGFVSPPSEEELRAADLKEKQRGRRVPMPIR